MSKGAIVAMGCGGSFRRKHVFTSHYVGEAVESYPYGDFSAQDPDALQNATASERLILDLAYARKEDDRPLHVLYIPTAGYDDMTRFSDMRAYWGDLGCRVSGLFLTRPAPTPEEVEFRIHNADVIYVGGGNTRYMMEMWRRHGVDKLIVEAYEHGAVLAGGSVGSICWFKGGWSDAEHIEGYDPWYPVWVPGLGLIDANHSPHFETKWRKRQTKFGPEGVTIALDDGAAFVVENGTYRVIANYSTARAYRCELRGKTYEKRMIPKEAARPLADIL